MTKMEERRLNRFNSNDDHKLPTPNPATIFNNALSPSLAPSCQLSSHFHFSLDPETLSQTPFLITSVLKLKGLYSPSIFLDINHRHYRIRFLVYRGARGAWRELCSLCILELTLAWKWLRHDEPCHQLVKWKKFGTAANMFGKLNDQGDHSDGLVLA